MDTLTQWAADLVGTSIIYHENVGDNNRLVFLHEGLAHAGCFVGSPDELASAVKEKYPEDSDGYKEYMLCVEMFNTYLGVE